MVHLIFYLYKILYLSEYFRRCCPTAVQQSHLPKASLDHGSHPCACVYCTLSQGVVCECMYALAMLYNACGHFSHQCVCVYIVYMLG